MTGDARATTHTASPVSAGADPASAPAFGSLRDVLASAAALLGRVSSDPLGLLDRLGHRRTVVVVLVDGLGHRLLPLLAPHAPLLSELAGGGSAELVLPLRCGFPSTTPASLVSLGTGATPGEHGVLGFTVLVPGTARVLNHVLWRDDPPPDRWQPVPTWFARLRAAGVDARAVLPAEFLGSGLTRAAYGGARFVPVPSASPGATVLAAEAAAGPGLVYGYLNALDTAMHLHGVGSPEWLRAAAAVDADLSRVLAALPDDAVLLITGDHGGLNAGLRVDLDTDSRLSAGVRYVAGEPRVRYLHVEPGAAADVGDAWAQVLGEHAEVLLRDEAVGRGLFGPVAAGHLARIGDVVVMCTDDTVVLATAHEPPQISSLIGYHGALTADELAVPLLVGTR